MLKTLKELRNELGPKMIEVEGGGFRNPYSASESTSPHPYRSRALDEAVKFFTAKELGEERRVKHLGSKWKKLEC
jgi:hypothetical protein